MNYSFLSIWQPVSEFDTFFLQACILRFTPIIHAASIAKFLPTVFFLRIWPPRKSRKIFLREISVQIYPSLIYEHAKVVFKTAQMCMKNESTQVMQTLTEQTSNILAGRAGLSKKILNPKIWIGMPIMLAEMECIRLLLYIVLKNFIKLQRLMLKIWEIWVSIRNMIFSKVNSSWNICCAKTSMQSNILNDLGQVTVIS